MNTKKTLALFIMLLPMMALWAQVEIATQKGIISEVKQSEEQFFYADQTSTTVDQALQHANDLLMKELQDYFKAMGIDFEASKDKIVDNMVTITMQRGDQFRAFVYIEKSLFNDSEKSLAVEAEKTSVVEEIAPVVPSVSKSNNDDGVFSQMATMESRLQVYDYVSQLQADGMPITFVNQPKTENMDGMYLVLYRRGGAIEAILTPVDAEGVRRNLTSGEPDDLTRHPNTSINGIKFEQ
jgi:hypothetical protein